MTDITIRALPRRMVLGGVAAAGLLAIPGCATMGYGGFSELRAVRRLLEIASRNAFSRLTTTGGFWDSQVARLPLPDLFGSRGNLMQSILTSPIFKDRLQHALNDYAVDGARRAAPLVAETIRTIGFANAVALLRGGPTNATSYLRSQMGPALINAMIPALGDAMRVANDPLIGQAVTALSGVDVGQVAQAVANEADNAIWYSIGLEETAIRQDPSWANDRLLMEAFKTG